MELSPIAAEEKDDDRGTMSPTEEGAMHVMTEQLLSNVDNNSSSSGSGNRSDSSMSSCFPLRLFRNGGGGGDGSSSLIMRMSNRMIVT